MEITYKKSYSEQDFKHFILYGNLSFKSTNVFWEYYNLIKSFGDKTKIEIINEIKLYKKVSKSNLRISYSDNEIEFYIYSKYIFPEFYIIFKNK